MENNGDHHQLPPPSYSQPLPSASYSQPQPSVSYSQPPPYSLQLRNYWIEQMMMGNASDVRNHQLPLVRIKKIMKSDPDVHMVSAEAPILLSKACEMFITDLTMRSWFHAVEPRQTIMRSDISAAVSRSFNFRFLDEVVPSDESVAAGPVAMPHQDGGVLPPEMVIGHPVVGRNGMYQPQTQEWAEWPEAAPGEGEEEADEEIGGSSGGN